MDFYRQFQLGEEVRRYKVATRKFQDWLLDTANQRKVELDIVNEAKQAKGTKSHAITIDQHVKFAQRRGRTPASRRCHP